MVLYENVVKLCKERGISIMALEQACSIGNGTIGEWKSRGNPRIDTLKKVADYLGVTVLDLIAEGKDD